MICLLIVTGIQTCISKNIHSCAEGEAVSGDEFDREEELRGYNRAIDFTLHTILEESGEDSEPELRAARGPAQRKRYVQQMFNLPGVVGHEDSEPEFRAAKGPAQRKR